MLEYRNHVKWINKNSFVCTSINEVYKKILYHCFSEGHETNVRGYETKDLSFTQFVFTHPEMNILLDKKRKLNYAFMFRELWWYLTGDNRLKPLDNMNRNIKMFSDDGETMFGAYGPYIIKQIVPTIKKLKEDKFTRQAVITINSMEHNVEGFAVKSKDIPCTMFLHFISYNGKHLNLISHMRSQDLWWGFPYDVASFSLILSIISKYLGFEVGWFIHNIDSTHIYIERSNEIINYINSKEDNILYSYNDYINHDISTSWLKDKIFWGENKLISSVDEIYDACQLEHDDYFHDLCDELFESIKLEPLLMIEHVCVMVCYLMQQKRIPMYNYDKWNKVLIDIGSPFKWIL